MSVFVRHYYEKEVNKMSRYYRYKNGAEVTVRADLEKYKNYFMRSGYRANDAYKSATQRQVDRAGKIVHIESKKDGRYFIREDWGCDAWTDDMFDPIGECVCMSLL